MHIMIFENTIHWYMYKYFKTNIMWLYFSIANHKCTPSDRQMYPWGYMYPRLGISGLDEEKKILMSASLVHYPSIAKLT